MTAEEKKPVEEAIVELNKVKNGDDLEAIKKATQNLSEAAQKIGEKLYKAAEESGSKEQGAGSNPESGNPHPDTEPKDAEVEDGKKE